LNRGGGGWLFGPPEPTERPEGGAVDISIENVSPDSAGKIVEVARSLVDCLRPAPGYAGISSCHACRAYSYTSRDGLVHDPDCPYLALSHLLADLGDVSVPNVEKRTGRVVLEGPFDGKGGRSGSRFHLGGAYRVRLEGTDVVLPVRRATFRMETEELAAVELEMIGVVADLASVVRMRGQPDLPPTGVVEDVEPSPDGSVRIRPILGEDDMGRVFDGPVSARPLHANLPPPPWGFTVPLYRQGYEILHGPPVRDIFIENVEQGKEPPQQEDSEPRQ